MRNRDSSNSNPGSHDGLPGEPGRGRPAGLAYVTRMLLPCRLRPLAPLLLKCTSDEPKRAETIAYRCQLACFWPRRRGFC
jgi:hypothetical protein